MEDKKYLVFDKDVLERLQKTFNIVQNGNGWTYISPNKMIKQNLMFDAPTPYGSPSFILISTSEIETYPAIADDFMNFFDFQKSFDLENVDGFIKRMGNIKE